MKFAIDLDKVFEKHKEFCSYEAEVFPGSFGRWVTERTRLPDDGPQNRVADFCFRKVGLDWRKEEK